MLLEEGSVCFAVAGAGCACAVGEIIPLSSSFALPMLVLSAEIDLDWLLTLFKEGCACFAAAGVGCAEGGMISLPSSVFLTSPVLSASIDFDWI